ncbi:hypothetical protein [Weissella viridescens]|uniref:hypothetical protein n=1 Tax=Weissella viridescens TaxID=1629 RepID=UPI004055E2B2
MVDLDEDALHSTYSEIYKVLGKDSDALMNLFEKMSGQQLNLPVHLYDPEMVKTKLNERVIRHESIDVNEAAEYYGYSRRWIRTVIRDAERQEKEKG